MADTPNELGAAEQASTDVETPSNPPQDAAPANESNEGLNADSTATEETNKGYWPEDWRERYVDKLTDKSGKPLDDAAKDKMAKRLSRYASPRAMIDAGISAQNKISAGGMIKVPGEDSTPEEIAQYRADMGVPEEAKGYDLSLNDGLVIGDEDKDIVNSFLEVAHAGNYSQEQVTEGLNWYYKNQENMLVEQYESDARHRANAEEELRTEWGPEYQANRNLMANYLGSDFAEGTAELIVGARLADGTPLGNHPDILRGFVTKARAANPMGALVPGTGTKQHDAMVSEIDALEKKMGDNGALTGKDQDRYLKLVSARDGIPEK